jgi:hypothetical protein
MEEVMCRNDSGYLLENYEEERFHKNGKRSLRNQADSFDNWLYEN